MDLLKAGRLPELGDALAGPTTRAAQAKEKVPAEKEKAAGRAARQKEGQRRPKGPPQQQKSDPGVPFTVRW